MTNEDTFRGDNDQLVSNMRALVELDKAGALVPHGIGGHARGLLSAAAARLSQHSGEVTPMMVLAVMSEVDMAYMVDNTARDDEGRNITDEVEEMAKLLNVLLKPAPDVRKLVLCMQELPPDETPVLVVYKGQWRVAEIRWEHPTHEETFSSFQYWDDPYDKGQEWDWNDVIAWVPLDGPAPAIGNLCGDEELLKKLRVYSQSLPVMSQRFSWTDVLKIVQAHLRPD